ncbi:flavin reductase family protein [Marinactinospora rubrisoli]|uniref:Flavin reductase family protein n=1 Tax=Marinactinospora rubrisoli TaxID=2715399 RepID=A0ABW2KKM3_9ACTN
MDHARPGASRVPVPAGGDAAETPDISPDGFRHALAGHPAGVVVVTARVGGEPVGLTASSFTSVSLRPPLVSFYVADGSSTWPRLRRAGRFAVTLLAEDQSTLAARFASREADRFGAPTAWRTGPHGTPLLDGATAHLVCRTHEIRALGDHWLVVGRVAGAEVHRTDAPLLYHRGTFGAFRRHA